MRRERGASARTERALTRARDAQLGSSHSTSADFDASTVFHDLTNEFKDWLVLNWIATTVWSHQTPTGTASTRWMKEYDQASKTSSQFPITQTTLEGMFGHTAGSIEIPINLKAEFPTYWSQGWLSSIFSPPDQPNHTFDSAVEDMMGKLLLQKEYDLASDFSKFLPESNWSSYLKGRLHIALGENHLASLSFQKPAYNLGMYISPDVCHDIPLTQPALGIGFSIDMSDTAHLVPELEQDMFSDGLPRYYNHVLGLFEKARAYSYASEFAQLGLNSMMGSEDQNLKSELLQRLFTASMQTSRFEEAYTALVRHSDSALYGTLTRLAREEHDANFSTENYPRSRHWSRRWLHSPRRQHFSSFL